MQISKVIGKMTLPVRFAPRVIKKLFYFSKFIFSFPMAIFVSAIFPFYKIKLVGLFSDRIGHYALNTELMLCTLETKLFEKKSHYIFYTKPKSVPLSNTQLDKMWKRVIIILPFPVIAEQIDSLLKLLLGRKYSQDKIKVTFEPGPGADDFQGLLKR